MVPTHPPFKCMGGWRPHNPRQIRRIPQSHMEDIKPESACSAPLRFALNAIQSTSESAGYALNRERGPQKAPKAFWGKGPKRKEQADNRLKLIHCPILR